MDISGVAAALHSRLPELGERIAQRIRSDVDAYDEESLIPSTRCAARAPPTRTWC